jgi:hypothetical protein
VTKASSNETLFPLNNIAIAGTGVNAYTVQLTPDSNQFGTATITLTVTDDSLASATTTFTVTVYPINDLPVATDDSLAVNEDTTLTFSAASLVTNDVDVDDVLQITKVTDPTHGRMSYNTGSGQYSYQPDANYYGTDTFDYTVTDGEATDTATVTITVRPVNDNPVAYSNWWTVGASLGATYTGDVRTNDYDIETSDEHLTVNIVKNPDHGTAAVNGDGTVTYTRDATLHSDDWSDSFTYYVNDDNTPPGVSNTVTVYIDDYWGPSIYGDDQWFSMDEDHSLGMTLAIHDGYGAGYTVAFSTPKLGTITDTNNADAVITYIPNANAYGSEIITYTLTSKSTGNPTGSGKFYVTIYPINDAPTITPALSDVTIDEDTSTSTLHVDISDVETNASDLIFTASSSNSDVVLDSGISVTRSGGSIDLVITPIANRFGETTITLLASDSVAQTTQSFKLTVSPVNDVPVADDISTSTNEDNPVTVTVVSPNADMDGDSLIVTTPGQPEHGSLKINNDKTVTYTPAVNYNGVDSFTYQLADASSSDTGVVTVTVNPVNDPPQITDLTYLQNTLEDVAKTVTFKISDVDNTLTSEDVSIATDNTTLLPAGAISLSGTDGDISVTLTPAANLSGTAIQTVSVSDGEYTISQDFKLVAAAVNDLPTAYNDNATTNEDASVKIDVISNDTDIETGTLTVVSFATPGNGSVVNNHDGTLTYTPSANWNGTDSFTYTISDTNNGQATATVTITVNPVNDAPAAGTDSATILEDNSVTLNLLSNDSDVEGSSLTITKINTPTKGTFVDHLDGTITYTPNTNQNGVDTFTYVVSDGELTSTGTVKITITPINDAPIFSTSVALPWTLNEDTPKSFPITITDPETASDNLVAKITSSDQTLIPDTSITLTGSGQNKYLELSPLLNKFGTLDLTIEVSDGVNKTTGVYPVTVLSVNDLPTISSIADQTTKEDTATNAISFTVSDVETPAADLTVTAATVNGTLLPAGNVVVTKGSGGSRTVVLTPGANRVGSTSVTLTVHDADGGTADESLTLAVNAVNDAPTAVANVASVDEDNSVVINVLANDTDPDLANEGDALSIDSVSDVNTSIGAVTIAPDKQSVTFTPASNWNGTQAFSYTMKDAAGVTSKTTVTVTVHPVNDGPVAYEDAATTTEDHAVAINVLANDTDIDLSREGDTLTVLSTAGVDHGTVSIAENLKSITFTPQKDWYGTEVFTYTLKDSHDAEASNEVTVTVTPVNDPPVISDISDQTLTEDTTSQVINFTVSDVESSAADLIVSATTSNGTRIPVGNVVFGGMDGNRTLTITPAANRNTWNSGTSAHNPVTLTITVSDGSLTGSDSFAVTINPVNDAPAATNDSATTNEDTVVTVNVLANDSDVDISSAGIANEGDVLTVTGVTGVDNGTAAITGSGKTITFTPASNFNGSETFAYTIQDSAGAAATANVTVTVKAVNDAPTISDVTDQTINEDSTTGALSFTISDVDSSITCANVTASSDTPSIILNANAVIGGSGTNCTVTVTPLANQNTYGKSPVTMTLVVSDGTLPASDQFTVTILNVNDGPTAINDTGSTTEDTPVTVNVLKNDTDADLANEGDVLTVVSTSGVDHGEASIDPATYAVTFTPEADWSGTETFSYTIEDSVHVSSTGSVTVSVSPANDAPHAVDDTAGVDEDGSVDISPLTNDTDVDLSREGDTLTITAYSGVDHGTVSIATDKKSLRFEPDADWVGTEVFQYTLQDAAKVSSSANISVTVNPVNDPPTAHDDTLSSQEDTTASLDVLANDTDVDLTYEGDNLLLLSVSGALHGDASVATDQKTITYVPDENWNGSETLVYSMEDKDHRVSSATVSLEIEPVNDAPQAFADEGDTQEDTPVKLTVLDNDQDIDLDNEGDAFSIVSTSGVDNGTVTLSDDKQSLTFTPASNWNGVEEFTYLMQDRGKATSSGTVTVTVAPVNDLPDAVNDSVTTSEDQSIAIQVLTNDTDVDLLHEGDTLLITATTGVENGTTTISSDQTQITFKPDPDWNGTEFFNYEIQDKAGKKDSATVTVIVSPVNDAPVAHADSYTVNEDEPNTLNVLSNDSDVDTGDDITLSAISEVKNATVTIASDRKSLSFQANADWNGSVEFSYTVTDKAGATSTASVTVQVDPVNDPPVAQDDEVTLDEDSSITINALENDSDVDTLHEGDTLTISAVSDVDNGHYILVNENKSILFTPNSDWNGVELFTYQVRDSHGATTTASVKVTVTPQPDSSTAVADAASCDEDGSVTIDVLTNDIDADLAHGEDSLTVTSVGDVDHGTVGISDDKSSVKFSPSLNWNGTEVFTYTIADTNGSTSSALVTVTVKPVNDAPTAVKDEISTDEDVPVTIDVLKNDTDVDLDREGDSLTITGTSGEFKDSVSIAPDGKTLTFTPPADWYGEKTFTYTMQDHAGRSSSAPITVTVHPIDDAPVISAIEDQTIDEDTLAGPIGIALTDVDNLADDVSVYATSSNHDVVSDSGLVITGSGGSRSISITPIQNKNTSGTSPVTITLHASSSLTASSTKSFTLTIHPVNDNPQGFADVAKMDEDTALTLSPLDNDTDVDILNEGDDLTIVSTAGLDHGTVKIIDAGKKLVYTPNGNWYGLEEFTYTLQDRAGVQASAAIAVSVSDVDDSEPVTTFYTPYAPNPGTLDFEAMVPEGTEMYTDGSSVDLHWTALKIPGVTYTVEFFDGTTWQTLATGVTGTSFAHSLVDTNLMTDSAYYRVSANIGSSTKILAETDPITIDNYDPKDLTIQTRSGDGGDYLVGTSISQPAQITVTGGQIQTGITIRVMDGDQEIASGPSGLTVNVTTPGVHVITIVVIDPLGNTFIARQYSIVIQPFEKPTARAEQASTATPTATPSALPSIVAPAKPFPPASGTGLCLGVILGIFLILLLCWPNVKIVYLYRKADGGMRRVVRYRRVFAPRDDALNIRVKGADAYEITLSRWLTRSVRGGSLTIHPQGGAAGQWTTSIPKETKDRFKMRF